MPLTLEEILALSDIGQKINYLKKGRKTELPDCCKLWDDWNPERHEIMVDKEKYPDRKVLEKEAEKVFDEKTGKTYEIEAQYKTEPVNRISIPLEQDIVNIQTAFTVGTEPFMDCTPTDDDEKKLLDAVKAVFKSNKIKYQNKKIVRAWLSEQEVAEYWYVTDDDSFWAKFWKKVKTTFGGKVKPTKKLKSVLWSPFRGDKLYPFFNDEGKMIAFSREYKKKLMDDSETTCFMTITDKMVYQWDLAKGYEERMSFAHGFPKLPVLYAYRPEPYCKKIKTFRVRLEKLLSNYADCIDYHFFPLLKLVGSVAGFAGKTKDRIVKLEDGADAQYLTWNQVPETIRFEAETLTNNAYDMSNTPRISFETLKGVGKASGTAFRFMFMGAHMSVSNHAEVIGEFLQRRVNFLVTALGAINPTEFNKASQTIDIETDLVPFMIDSEDDNVNTAVRAVEGKIWSRREGIMFAGNADRVDEILKEIQEDEILNKEQNRNAGN